jgi:hypothetical protein
MGLPDAFLDLPAPVAAWLGDMVTRYGLPMSGRKWSGLLRGRALDDWMALHWETRTVVLEPEVLTQDSWRMIKQLIEANWCDADNVYSAEEWRVDSVSKFAEIDSFLSVHRSLPGDLIFLDAGGFLEVVDGCHRLALFFVRRYQDADLKLEHEVWVGVA